MKYRIDKPYPAIKVEGPNQYFAHLLKEDYSGDISELSAVLLYSYQHIVSDARLKEYASLIHHISIVEMYHLELLGETIQLLGSDAEFTTINPKTETTIPWTSIYINNATDLKGMLELDIASEEQAIDHYERHLTMIDDHYIQNLLLHIIQDEKLHLQLFREFYQKHFSS